MHIRYNFIRVLLCRDNYQEYSLCRMTSRLPILNVDTSLPSQLLNCMLSSRIITSCVYVLGTRELCISLLHEETSWLAVLLQNMNCQLYPFSIILHHFLSYRVVQAFAALKRKVIKLQLLSKLHCGSPLKTTAAVIMNKSLPNRLTPLRANQLYYTFIGQGLTK